jgi:hypothetical protein
MRQGTIAAAVAAALAAIGLAQSQNIFHKAPPEVEEKLRARVIEFYSLYQQGKFRQAEKLVAEESRDLYYNMQKAPIRSFQLEQIMWDDNFTNATVLVACLSAAPRTASAGIWVPINGKWKLENGDWYMLIKPRTTTPFGPMHFDNPANVKPQPFQRPTLEMLRENAIGVEPRKLEFPADTTEPVTRRVTVQNNMAGLLTVFVQDPKIPGLATFLADQNILPQKAALVEVTYDPAKGKLTGKRELRLTLQPLNQEIAIELLFQ